MDTFLLIISLKFLITNPAETVTITGTTFLMIWKVFQISESSYEIIIDLTFKDGFWTEKLNDQGILPKLLIYEMFEKHFFFLSRNDFFNFREVWTIKVTMCCNNMALRKFV